MEPQLFIGMMSGTSLDGIDAVILDGDTNTVISSRAGNFPADIHDELYQLITSGKDLRLDDAKELHDKLAHVYADNIEQLLAAADISSSRITAIGNHGQTVCHRPDANPPWTLQLGNPQLLANLTGIPVVGDFRSADIGLGGQGAPLVPAFHKAAFTKQGLHQVIVNIGGIANITLIDANGNVSGCDTGPGNTLLDEWCKLHLNQSFDADGQWAASGSVSTQLLEKLLADPWLQLAPPKSTGREYFNMVWLDKVLSSVDEIPEPADIQATLCELTARSISDAIVRNGQKPETVAVCGGGARNRQLMHRISAHLPDSVVCDTSVYGIEPEWVEAAAFAWLAKARLNERPGNIPAVTGASGETLLGDIFKPE